MTTSARLPEAPSEETHFAVPGVFVNRKPVLNIAAASMGLLSIALSDAASAVVVTVDSLANRIPWDQLSNSERSGKDQSKYQSQVQVTLAAGTYDFSFVAGAWNAWGKSPPTQCTADGQCTGVVFYSLTYEPESI